jgi:hypothetical protein
MFQIPFKGYFGHVSLKSLLNTMYEFVVCIAHLVYKPDICGVFCGLCFSTRGVLDTTICDKVCKRLAAGRSFSMGALVFSINKTATI